MFPKLVCISFAVIHVGKLSAAPLFSIVAPFIGHGGVNTHACGALTEQVRVHF
jgi:hypothetical protein